MTRRANHPFVTADTAQGMRDKFRENLANPLCSKPGCNLRLKDHPTTPVRTEEVNP